MANDTLLYIVNFENNEGFAVVSASNTTEPLFGIADEGNFDLAQAASNPNFNFYLERASEYVSENMFGTGISIPSGPIGPNTPIGPSDPGTPTDSLKPNYTLIASKGPYVSLKWGQGSPYGDRFENGNCGSLASVIGMIALTVGWPQDLDRWGIIASHISNGEGCTEDTANVHPRIARMMEDLYTDYGHECIGGNTIYKLMEGDNTFSYPTAYSQLFISESTDSVKHVIRHLNEYETDHYNAFAYAATGTYDYNRLLTIDHCWLIDGYKTVRHVAVTDTTTYLHCNWACDGEGNGFFLPTSNFQTALSFDKQGHTTHPQVNNDVIYGLMSKTVITGSNKMK